MRNAAATERGSPMTRGTGSSFFTIARFEPDTLAVFCLLAAAAEVLYVLGSTYLSILMVWALAVIFLIEASETISPERAEYRQIVGSRCIVLKRASLTERGIARLLRADGRLDAELWSFEASSPFKEGEAALVCGTRGVVLEIEPICEVTRLVVASS
jgi:membrane protein implicated in regulation of membrane protease activity